MGSEAIGRVSRTVPGRLAGAALAATMWLGAAVVAPAAEVAVAAPDCTPGKLDAAQLNAIFASPGVGGSQGYAGGDYPHAYPLPDGRVLWLFQDVFYSGDNDLRDSLTAAAHNGGVVQSGSCFTTIGGPGHNAIGNEGTQPLSRWFWALDGEIGYDGMLWIFLAEMRNPNGTGAGLGTAPSGTFLARIDPATLEVLSVAPAPDASASLYGWSVVSTDRYSYLYGHCYRQYVHDVNGPGQFDSTCMPKAYLARVPVGRFDVAPEYFAGSGASGSMWSTDASAAVPFSYRPPTGTDVIVRGRLDCLVIRADGAATIVEFKTGRPRPEHEAQAAMYRDALQAALPGRSIDIRLVYA